MDRSKGIAYCGMACYVCGHNADCVGCRNDGCEGKDWCEAHRCCPDRGLKGCWECDAFPCDSTMFEKPRVRAFVRFIAEYGEERLMDCLARNEAAGMAYHYEGSLSGDYDIPDTEEEIIRLVLYGRGEQ